MTNTPNTPPTRCASCDASIEPTIGRWPLESKPCTSCGAPLPLLHRNTDPPG